VGNRFPLAIAFPIGIVKPGSATRRAINPRDRILFASSADGNGSWTDPNIQAASSTDYFHILHPVITRLDDDHIWFVYAKGRESDGGYGIRFVRSDDGGQTFGDPVTVDDGSPSGVYDLTPHALACGDTVCVAWYEFDPGHIRFNRSFDGGITWLPTDAVINDDYLNQEFSRTTLGYDPSLSRLYILWATRSGTLWIAHSDDFGASWSPPRHVNDSAAVNCDAPDFRVGPDGTLYAVWADFRNGTDVDTYFSRSEDHGFTWLEPAIKVNDEVVWGNHYEPHLDLGPDGVLHASFIHNVPFELNVNLFYTRSADGGYTWEHPLSRVNQLPNVVAPDVPVTTTLFGAAGAAAYVAWRDDRGSDKTAIDVYCASNLEATGAPEWTPTGGDLSLQISPNPASNRVEFSLRSVPGEGVEIRIYDLQGRRVAGGRIGGDSPWTWNLRDQEGRRVSAGIYLARMRAGPAKAVRPFVVLR